MSCAQMCHQKNRKVSREHVYICGFTRQKSTVNQTLHRLQAQHRKRYQFYVDAYFSVGWAQSYFDNIDIVMFRTEYVITYAGRPVLWCSKS